MEWRDAEPAEAETLRRLVRRFMPLEAEAQVRLRTLSFFRAGDLVQVGRADSFCHFVRTRQGSLLPLSGRCEDIWRCIDACGLSLDRDTVASYTAFYCHFLEVDGSDLMLLKAMPEGFRLERPLNPDRIAPQVAQRRHHTGAYRLLAHARYRDRVYRCSFRIHRQGHVEMVRDKDLGPLFRLQ
ncbi:hypothetical protein [Methylobacterium tarhaniae]|uniref:hypothetical protein n=1 Tax=Methylobacterium tarhaniae TaxID=1187852 RepID=UPI003D04EB07